MTRIDAPFPYLSVRGARDAMAFHARVFGAVEEMRLVSPDGTVAHGEMRFGAATRMRAEERPDAGFPSPLSLGGTPVLLHLHVDDIDAAGRGGGRHPPPPARGRGARRAAAQAARPVRPRVAAGQDLGVVALEEMQRILGRNADGG